MGQVSKAICSWAMSGKPKEKESRSVLHVRIDPELKAKLVLIAEKSGMDLSNYARAAMIEKAKRDGHKV